MAACVVVGLLARELGWPATLAGASTMAAFVALQFYFGDKFAKRRRITAKVRSQPTLLAFLLRALEFTNI